MRRILIALMLTIAIAAACGTTNSHPAVRLARQWVKSELISPATAKFAGGERIFHNDDGTISVVGEVDSHNLLGATTRKVYNCRYRHDSRGWTRVAKVIMPRHTLQQSR